MSYMLITSHMSSTHDPLMVGHYCTCIMTRH